MPARMAVRFVLGCLFLWGITSAFAANDPVLEKLFQARGVSGTLVIALLDGKTTYVHNAERAAQPFLPASTFKIPNTLIALDLGVIRDERESIAWDGVDRGLAAWNRDQTLETALPSSCVWFYQALAERVGQARYLEQLKRLGYGNWQTGPDVRTFWLDGNLRISALEQIGFLQRFYTGQLPFKPEHIALTKRLMLVEQTNAYTLAAKTGWTMRVAPQIGWYVGYVETGGQVWLFALNLDIVRPGDERFREEIVKAALRGKQLLPG